MIMVSKDKAYIVANEQQEREVLEILQANGFKWVIGTYSQFRPLTGFPYVIYESDTSNVLKSGRVPKLNVYSTDVIYDGRKEEHMSEKYRVSQEFMNELKEWKSNTVDGVFINGEDINNLPYTIGNWWCDSDISNVESNNCLIAIIRWVNGEDVFEVEKPKKWIVRSKETDDDGNYIYVLTRKHGMSLNRYNINEATRFDTKEEAQSWANAHQEVIEVDK